jgi:hypothetical protein
MKIYPDLLYACKQWRLCGQLKCLVYFPIFQLANMQWYRSHDSDGWYQNMKLLSHDWIHVTCVYVPHTKYSQVVSSKSQKYVPANNCHLMVLSRAYRLLWGSISPWYYITYCKLRYAVTYTCHFNCFIFSLTAVESLRLRALVGFEIFLHV